MRRLLFFAVAALGCGTNAPEIPPELLQPAGSCNSSLYPPGPYGAEPETTAQNFCFQGWARPDTVEHTEASLQDLAFSTFHDETGERDELLLVNSAAVWCSVCRTEHEDLPARHEQFGPRGLVIFSALFQDAKAGPAKFDDLKVWVETFDTPFPMVLDPSFQLGAYASPETAPLNMLIDARTMKILQKYVGDQSTRLWDFVDTELSGREAAE